MNREIEPTGGPNETQVTPEASRIEQFYQAYNFLDRHPMYNMYKGDQDTPVLPSGEILTDPDFTRFLNIYVVKVNPISGRINKNSAKNTKVQVWLETGPYDPSLDPDMMKLQRVPGATHDIDLDSWGDTFEDAIIMLAEKVRANYDDGQSPQEHPTAA